MYQPITTPLYYCEDCEHEFTSDKKPSSCPECGKDNVQFSRNPLQYAPIKGFKLKNTGGGIYIHMKTMPDGTLYGLSDEDGVKVQDKYCTVMACHYTEDFEYIEEDGILYFDGVAEAEDYFERLAIRLEIIERVKVIREAHSNLAELWLGERTSEYCHEILTEKYPFGKDYWELSTDIDAWVESAKEKGIHCKIYSINGGIQI